MKRKRNPEQQSSIADFFQGDKTEGHQIPSRTCEQSQFIDSPSFKPGETVLVNAYAGTGKTATLVGRIGNAKRCTRANCLYLVFNAEMRSVAQERFTGILSPDQIHTYHSLAYHLLIKSHQYTLEVREFEYRKAVRQYVEKDSKNDDIQRLIPNDTKTAHQFWNAVFARMRSFCNSGDEDLSQRIKEAMKVQVSANKTKKEPDKKDAKEQEEEDDEQFSALDVWRTVEFIVEATDKRRQLRTVSYAMLIKLVHLKKCKLSEYSVIAVDEAQDMMPVVIAILRQQQQHSALILVGDAHQQINQWNGAVNAMQHMVSFAQNQKHFPLSQTHRFSSSVCNLINRLFVATGHPLVPALTTSVKDRKTQVFLFNISRLFDIGQHSRALVTRTKKRALKYLLFLLTNHFLDSGATLRLCPSLTSLIKGCVSQVYQIAKWSPNHCEREVKQAQENDDEDRASLIIAVREAVVNEGYTPERLVQLLKPLLRPSPNCAAAGGMTVDVFTAHSAKGKEWHTVFVGDDFDKTLEKLLPSTIPREPKRNDQRESENTDIPDRCCLYVALTRASHQLFLPDRLLMFYRVPPSDSVQF